MTCILQLLDNVLQCAMLFEILWTYECRFKEHIDIIQHLWMNVVGLDITRVKYCRGVRGNKVKQRHTEIEREREGVRRKKRVGIRKNPRWNLRKRCH